MTFSSAKFEVATSNGLGGDAFTSKYIIYLTFDIDLGAKGSWNVAQYPVYQVTYTAAKFEDPMSNGLEGDAFTRNAARYHLQHVIYTAAKFEVATSNDLGDTFTRKYIFELDIWVKVAQKCWPVPSLWFDICSYKIWSCYSQRLKRRYNYKKPYARTHGQTDERRTDFGTNKYTLFF